MEESRSTARQAGSPTANVTVLWGWRHKRPPRRPRPAIPPGSVWTSALISELCLRPVGGRLTDETPAAANRTGRNIIESIGQTYATSSGRSGLGALADDLVRVLLELDALVRGLTHQAVAGPTGELGSDDELGAEPLGIASGRTGRRSRECRRIGREWRDRGQELGPVRIRETRPDLAGVAQAAVLVDTDQERAEIDRPAGPLDPATDDELLFGTDLDLLPGHRARSGDVCRPTVLGHDPFEAAFSCDFEERDAVGFDVFAQADARVGAEDIGKESAAFLERFFEERSAIEMEQVEDLVDERGRLVGRSPPLDPCLEEGEVGLAMFVESDDLAVDDRPACIEPARRIEER